jgi:hypothetical protein
VCSLGWKKIQPGDDMVIGMDRDKVLGAFVGEGRFTEEQDSMS